MTNVIARRGVLRAMGATVIVAGGINASRGETQQAVPWSSGTEPPKLKAPPNACDCHMHIYDSRFPVAPNAKLRPPDATVDAYRLLQKRIGTTRNVVVTPSTYGTDNSCTLDAMAKLGATARGVAVVDTSVSRRRAQAAERSRRSRHPLQSRPVRRHHHRHARAVVEARQRSRLACANPYAGRPDRRDCGSSAAAALADRVRPYGAHSSNRLASIIRPSHWC